MKKQTLFSILAVFAVLVTFVAAMFIPASLAGASLAMAFIVNGVDYKGQENMDINIRPRFMGTKPTEMGIRVIDTQGASSYKLNFFGKIAHVLMPYVTGFAGGAASPKLQKKVVLAEFKAEAQYDKHDYAAMIFEQIVDRGGVKQNDIEGTHVLAAEREIFFSAVEGDVFTNFWLGDKALTHISAGTYPDGVTTYAAGAANKFYNVIDGILVKIKADLYQNYISKQTTITGWNTATYPTLFMADETGTCFAYSSAAARTAATVGSRLFSFAGGTTGTKTLTALNTSGFGGTIYLEKVTAGTFDLKANHADYIKNVTLPALTTDTAQTYMKRLLRICSPELRGLKAAGLLRFYVTDSVLNNYEDSLTTGTTESARNVVIDGVSRYTFNGIPLIPMGIDAAIESDMPTAFQKDWIILSTPQNLCLVINGSSNFSETRFWFNPDVNANRQRTQFEFGVDYILPELIAVATA